MTEPLRRTRGAALALFFIGAGALAFSAPSALPGPDGGARLVLQDGVPGTAAPTSTWASAAESGDSSSPPPERQGNAAGRRPQLRTGALVRGPSDPELMAIRSGAALLGLLAAPANAPPHV
ncbi:MAG: hypothetical protein WEA34_01695 [Gemmatimonadota bacterium]